MMHKVERNLDFQLKFKNGVISFLLFHCVYVKF